MPITAQRQPNISVDLILLPVLMRALSGEDLETLHAEIGPYISQRVAFFLAACRHGGLG